MGQKQHHESSNALCLSCQGKAGAQQWPERPTLLQTGCLSRSQLVAVHYCAPGSAAAAAAVVGGNPGRLVWSLQDSSTVTIRVGPQCGGEGRSRMGHLLRGNREKEPGCICSVRMSQVYAHVLACMLTFPSEMESIGVDDTLIHTQCDCWAEVGPQAHQEAARSLQQSMLPQRQQSM
eukprot:scaffold132327_cov31-Tisochrysis_lutea.AAC.1